MEKRCLGCMELYDDGLELCPHCGYVEGTRAEEAIHMSPGTILRHRYVVGKVLGYGGFGATYIAWDSRLEQKVAIKEYMPGEFSTRMPGQSQLTIFGGNKAEQFHDGKEKFVDEAKRLAKFQNEPGIVSIFDSFEENDTAYIVMEYLDGETLSEYLAREKTIPEDKAVEMLMPIMNSLEVIHQEGILHRDIAPDNIMLTKNGDVKLIDFGASRYATTSHSRSLTVIIKPGYSPEEQYRSRGDQGKYTDVYALAATLYKMITGVTPPDAMERRAKYENQNKDILVPPHKLNKKISLRRENAILNGMNVRIEDRTPDVETFVKELNSKTPAKRIYGKIKKIDIYAWPMWLKVALPTVFGLALVFGTLLLTGVIKFGGDYQQGIVIADNVVEVPDVIGKSKDEAIRLIEAGNLLATAGGSVESEYVEVGQIVMQTPAAGLYLEKNTVIVLTVNAGTGVEAAKDGISKVPYVIWNTQEEAIEKLQMAGLGEPEIVEQEDDNVAEGLVISTDPEAGTEVPEGTVIKLVVSKGLAPVEIPDVTGKTEEEAKEILGKLGLTVTADYEKSGTAAEGTVLKQSPKAGSQAERGSSVKLTVSSGKETVEVPNVVGKSRSEAESLIKEKGLVVNVVENYDASVTVGNVISQSPDAGSKQLTGATVTIYVSKGQQTVHVTGVSLDRSNLTLVIGDSATLSATVTPSNASDNAIGWSSSDSSVATVSGGKVTAVKAGTAKITVTTSDGAKTATCTVTVTPPVINVTGISLDRSSLTLTAGNTATLTATVSPSNATNKSVTWSSSDTSVATVSGGKVTAVKAGKATITAKTADGGKIASCTVTVNAATVSVTGVSLDQTTLTITAGKSATLTATVSPSNATNKNVTWSSSDTSVATVSGGKVTGVKAGTATITVKTENGGKTATCKVTVKAATVSVTGVSLDYSSIGLGKVGNTKTLTATVSPTNATNKSVTWSSSDTSIATVKDGVVTAVAPGTATITAKTADGGKTATCSVKVAAQLTLDPNGGTIDSANLQVVSVYPGEAYGTLPTPTRDGYNFAGWYTAASGGTQVSSSTTMGTSNTTIYAHWNQITYTYTVTYYSTNGTYLGSGSVTGAAGTSQTVSAPGYSGYNTPSSQTVTFDSSSKTVTFYYSPSGASTSPRSGNFTTNPVITYYVSFEYRNRTANSVQVRINWTTEIVSTGWMANGQKCKFTAGGTSTTFTIVPWNTWPSGTTGSVRSRSASSEWHTVSLSTTNATSVSISVYCYQCNSPGTDLSSAGYGNLSATWSINIPAY